LANVFYNKLILLFTINCLFLYKGGFILGLRRLKKYLNNAKILIICNLDKNIKAITELLQENSYNVLQAQDYNSALEVAFENEPDLILLSVDIQNMDSLALLKKLKTIHKIDSIPIIIFSTMKEPDEVVQCLNAGAADYLVMPFNHQELLARIRIHVTNRFAIKLIIQQNKELTESTQDLANALLNLKVQQEKTIEIEKLKSVLAMALTTNHELSQPLAVIQGNVELIKIKHPELEDNKQLQRILDSIENIVEKLKQFSSFDKISYQEYVGDEDMVKL